MNRLTQAVATFGALALAAAVTPSVASATPTPTTGVPPVSEAGGTEAGLDAASPEMRAALARDLDLTPAEVEERLAKERTATDLAEKIEKQFGDDFAGAWLDDQQRLVVAVTDNALVSDARALGVQSEVVDRSAADLEAVQERLDAADRPSPDKVAGWYVDVEQNSIVVQALPGGEGAAQKLVRSSGAAFDAVEIETVREGPEVYYDIVGGERYNLGSGGWCSVGFSVNGGFVTAGHCGDVGTTTSGTNGVSQGTFQGSSFPGNDYAWVQTNSNWTPTAEVTRYDGTTVTVEGSQEAPVGASICRSGGRTQWQCGEVQAKNQTVNYSAGPVYGLTQTSACADRGDSGGSFISGDQAQGVTSGGQIGCPGGTTYFQPVNEILSNYGLTLVTGDGDGDPPPPPPPEECDDYENSGSGSLSGNGDYDIHPGGSYFNSGSGTHEACLSGPGSADFDLYLQQWSWGSGWSTVASSLTPSSEESITYTGSSGYYRYVAYSYSGSGSYTIGFDTP